MNKASGSDEVPDELFQILKDDAVKVLHSTCQQIWKAQQWPQDWKQSVFIPIPRKAMPKNVQVKVKLLSCVRLVATPRTIAYHAPPSWDFPGKNTGMGCHFLLQKECSNYCTIALVSDASKVMLKIFQARLQQYVNCELPDVQAGFRKGRGTRDQIANLYWIVEKAREFQNVIYFCFIDYAKVVDWVGHNKLWKIL